MMKLILLFMALISGLSSLAHAAESDWLQTDFAKIRLISASETKGLTGSLDAGLEIQMEEGWKIYWRSPGEAGLPPQLFVNQARSPASFARLSFPLPKRFQLFGLDTFGYGGRLVLPVRFTFPADGSDLDLYTEFDGLICSDICVPVAGPLRLSLPAGAQQSSIYAQELAIANARVPRQQMAVLTASYRNDASGKGLLVQFDDNVQQYDLTISDILIEGLVGANFGKPEQLSDKRYFLPQTSGKAELQLGDPVTLTIDASDKDGTIFYETSIAVTAGISSSNDAISSNQSANLPIWLIAFLGGLILNLMPCVFPVLSIKVSSVLMMAGAHKRQIRARFFASAAGVLTSFALLALFLQIVRLAGQQIGWGIQFQNPVFLGVMTVIMGIFTLSLFDVVTIRMPAFVMRIIPARNHNVSSGLLSDFGAGMLATLLATPCSAPFVGTAVTYALSQSDVHLYGTLLMMGVGLASPWLLFGFMPQLVSALPKPGQWMVRLKQVLGLLMAGTFIWVLMLFGSAIGMTGDKQPVDANWIAFDEAVLDQLIADDKIIFVDVTADWCITCKANKAFVLDTEPVQALLAQSDVVMMQADWTLPDERISAFLARYERFGIPFDIIYSSAAPTGIILPEILTLSAIEKALGEANQ